jgi:hypothetical protein
MRGGRGGLAPAIVAVVALSACGLIGVKGGPAPGEAELEPDTQPIGEVIEVGSGSSLGLEWHYSVYESALGTCTVLDLSNQSGGRSCGVTLGVEGGGPITVASVASGSGMPSIVEGWATDEVAAVVIALEDGRHLPATLMSLERTGGDGVAFIAFVPEGLQMDRAVALDQAGQEIGTEVIDAP